MSRRTRKSPEVAGPVFRLPLGQRFEPPKIVLSPAIDVEAEKAKLGLDETIFELAMATNRPTSRARIKREIDRDIVEVLGQYTMLKVTRRK